MLQLIWGLLVPRMSSPSKSKVDKIEELKVFLYHLVTLLARNTLKTKDCLPGAMLPTTPSETVNLTNYSISWLEVEGKKFLVWLYVFRDHTQPACLLPGIPLMLEGGDTWSLLNGCDGEATGREVTVNTQFLYRPPTAVSILLFLLPAASLQSVMPVPISHTLSGPFSPSHKDQMRPSHTGCGQSCHINKLVCRGDDPCIHSIATKPGCMSRQ